MSTLRQCVMAATCMMVAASGPSAAESGAPEVSCTVVEIVASHEAAPFIDPVLVPLERKLRKPPFSGWNAFRAHAQETKVLRQQHPAQVRLTHGAFTGLLRERAANRLSLAITVDDNLGKRVVDTKIQLLVGEFMLVGRPLGDAQSHIVAMRCK